VAGETVVSTRHPGATDAHVPQPVRGDDGAVPVLESHCHVAATVNVLDRCGEPLLRCAGGVLHLVAEAVLRAAVGLDAPQGRVSAGGGARDRGGREPLNPLPPAPDLVVADALQFQALAWRFRPQFHDKNRRDVGKSQPGQAAHK
jgi:hypothetical protein